MQQKSHYGSAVFGINPSTATENQRLQIMWCWGEGDNDLLMGQGICPRWGNCQTQRTFHFRPTHSLSSVLIEPWGSSRSFPPTSTHPSAHSMMLEQSIWLNLSSGNQCGETTQHNWYRMWWCFFFFLHSSTHTYTKLEHPAKWRLKRRALL